MIRTTSTPSKHERGIATLKASAAKASASLKSKAQAKPEKSVNAISQNDQPSAAEIMKLPVFGPADVFPMLAEDELQELAADIKANGLKEPLVVGEIEDGDGKKVTMLIDGRNRREACRVAGVAPAVRYLNGEDPTAFVLSSNIHRRHMTKGQRAMAVAMILPEKQQGKKGTSEKISEVSGRYVNMARTVLSHSLPLAQTVLAGKPLAEAYNEAKTKLAEKQSEEERQESEKAAFEADLAKLRARYPELARRVVEDGLTLKAMLVEADELDIQAKSKRESLFTGLRNARTHMVGFASSDELPRLPEYLKDKKIKKEFVEIFRDEPAALMAMVSTMEAEMAALKEIISQIEEA